MIEPSNTISDVQRENNEFLFLDFSKNKGIDKNKQVGEFTCGKIYETVIWLLSKRQSVVSVV